jgi:Tn3 transposase DDE domain
MPRSFERSGAPEWLFVFKTSSGCFDGAGKACHLCGASRSPIRDVELRRRIHIGLNKGEARNALARAMFFNQLGELRDRTLENQKHRASGLNLVVAAIVLWNTVHLERAIQALRNKGR